MINAILNQVDELARIDAEIKRLEKIAKDLKAELISAFDSRSDKTDNKITGAIFVATIIVSTRRDLDRKKIESVYGEEFLAPFMRESTVKSVRIGHA